MRARLLPLAGWLRCPRMPSRVEFAALALACVRVELSARLAALRERVRGYAQ